MAARQRGGRKLAWAANRRAAPVVGEVPAYAGKPVPEKGPDAPRVRRDIPPDEPGKAGKRRTDRRDGLTAGATETPVEVTGDGRQRIGLPVSPQVEVSLAQGQGADLDPRGHRPLGDVQEELVLVQGERGAVGQIEQDLIGVRQAGPLVSQDDERAQSLLSGLEGRRGPDGGDPARQPAYRQAVPAVAGGGPARQIQPGAGQAYHGDHEGDVGRRHQPSR